MEKEMPLGVRFAVIHRVFRRQIDILLREKGLTGAQFFVLGQIVRMEDAGAEEINQRDLENAAHVTHPTMTEIIKRLEKKGFIGSCRSEKDKRSKAIVSTPLARAMLAESAQTDERVFSELCSGLTEEQIARLKEITDIMLENVMNKCRKEDGKVD